MKQIGSTSPCQRNTSTTSWRKQANTTCNPSSTPGTAALKTANIEDDRPLDKEQHAKYRRLVGKIQWLSYTRPDIRLATKEVARSRQQPTEHGNKRLKHLRPTIMMKDDKTPPDTNSHTDHAQQEERTLTGFVIHFLGSRQRSWV